MPDDAPMTTIEIPTLPTTALEPVAHDLYRDIHKGIRVELFAMVTDAARLDPADQPARAALAAHVGDVFELLVSHAEHEDAAIQPAIEAHLPALAERVEVDHLTLEARLEQLVELSADAARPDAADPGFQVHRFHLAAASFTSAYLEHQDVEERVIMPRLLEAVGLEAVMGIHGAIIAAIPPEDMVKSLAVMLPAMNVDGRTELLGGMQANAPAEVFAGVWSLAGSVLDPCDLAAVGRRLGIPT
jgi:hypothetical protein